MKSTTITPLSGKSTKVAALNENRFDRLTYMRRFRDRPSSDPCRFELLLNDPTTRSDSLAEPDLLTILSPGIQHAG